MSTAIAERYTDSFVEIEKINAAEYSIPFIDNMTDEEFTAYMQKAYDDHKAGRYYSLEEAEKILEEEENAVLSR